MPAVMDRDAALQRWPVCQPDFKDLMQSVLPKISSSFFSSDRLQTGSRAAPRVQFGSWPARSMTTSWPRGPRKYEAADTRYDGGGRDEAV